MSILAKSWSIRVLMDCKNLPQFGCGTQPFGRHRVRTRPDGDCESSREADITECGKSVTSFSITPEYVTRSVVDGRRRGHSLIIRPQTRTLSKLLSCRMRSAHASRADGTTRCDSWSWPTMPSAQACRPIALQMRLPRLRRRRWPLVFLAVPQDEFALHSMFAATQTSDSFLRNRRKPQLSAQNRRIGSGGGTRTPDPRIMIPVL
jgi:hypothetical protein